MDETGGLFTLVGLEEFSADEQVACEDLLEMLDGWLAFVGPLHGLEGFGDLADLLYLAVVGADSFVDWL